MRGVSPRPRALRATRPAFLAWRGWSRTARMMLEHFAWGFANDLPAADNRTAYDRHVISSAGRLYFQLATGIGTAVNSRNANPAALRLIAGENHRTIEPKMAPANYETYRRSPAMTELKSFAKGQ